MLIREPIIRALSLAQLAGPLLFGIAGEVLAIDAANVARPASYIFRKQGDTTVENGGNTTSQKEPAQGAAAIFAPNSTTTTTAPSQAQQVVPKRPPAKPGSVELTSSGKPFVPVAPNSKCTVSAAGGADLEAQLRACAGLTGPARNTATGTTTHPPTKSEAQSPKAAAATRH